MADEMSAHTLVVAICIAIPAAAIELGIAWWLGRRLARRGR
jgi:hypothetical protein